MVGQCDPKNEKTQQKQNLRHNKNKVIFFMATDTGRIENCLKEKHLFQNFHIKKFNCYILKMASSQSSLVIS